MKAYGGFEALMRFQAIEGQETRTPADVAEMAALDEILHATFDCLACDEMDQSDSCLDAQYGHDFVPYPKSDAPDQGSVRAVRTTP